MVGPLAKPLPPPPEWLPKFTKSIEGQLVSDQIKAKVFEDGFNQGTYTMYAVVANLLVWHYDELKDFNTRMVVMEDIVNKLLDKIEYPDEEQKFAEWLYCKQTGFKMERKANEEMKPYAKELAAALRNVISEKKITHREIAKACNISLKKMDSTILYNGGATKDQFDAIVKFIGWDMSSAEKSMYESCYLSKASNNEKMAKMEAELRAKEAEPIELKVPEQLKEAVGEVVEPDPVIEVAPADVQDVQENVQEAQEVVQENVQEEDLPFADVNEMYKEAEAMPEIIIPDIKAAIEKENGVFEMESMGLKDLVAEWEQKIQQAKARMEALEARIATNNAYLNMREEAAKL